MINIMIIGAYIWGAIYTLLIAVAGLLWGDHYAVLAVIFSAGMAYACQMSSALTLDGQATKLISTTTAGWACVASIIAGVGAGVLLFAGM